MNKPLVAHVGNKLVLLRESTADEVRRMIKSGNDWKKALVTAIGKGHATIETGRRSSN